MAYVLGSAVKKARRDSYEGHVEMVQRLMAEEHGPLNIVATFPDHVLAFTDDKQLRKISYEITESGDLQVTGNVASRAIPVIEEAQVASHVSKGIRKIASRLSKGGATQGMRTQVRELLPFIKKDEAYWMSDVVSGIEESLSADSDWYQMYEANIERVRTTLHGRIREIEGRVPKVYFAKLAKSKLNDFDKEIKESMGILSDLYSEFIRVCDGVSFDDKREFLRAVNESLRVEAQAVVGLLGKADRLSGRSVDLPLVAQAHDKLADRARIMALVTEYLKGKALEPRNKE